MKTVRKTLTVNLLASRYFSFIIIFLFSSCNFGVIEPVIIESGNLEDGHKICIIGDSGMGNDGQRIVSSALQSENCNKIYLLGDAVYNDGIESASDPQLAEKFLKPYHELLKTTEFYILMGNHDYKTNPRAWIDIAKKYKNINFPEVVYANIFGDLCIIAFDTNDYFLQQINWIDKIKPRLNKCKLTISMGHHPYYSVGSHGDANFIIKKFLEKTALKVSDAYFAGHDHNLSDEGMYDRTHLFVSGAASKLRALKSKPRVWAKSKLGYIRLTIKRVTELKVSFSFITVDPKTTKKSIDHSGIL